MSVFGSISRIRWLLRYKPDTCGDIPVKTAVREGLHAGAGQCAFVNSVPEAAKRSRLGVRVWGCPPMQPIQSFRSSIEMNKTLGRSSPAYEEMAKINRFVRENFVNCIGKLAFLLQP